MKSCSICEYDGETKHMAIYAFGSEGVHVCEDCNRALAETVRGMRSAANRRHKMALKEEVARLTVLSRQYRGCHG